MTIINPEGKNPEESFQAQPRYEVSVAVYNKKSGKWESGSSYVEEKAARFLEESGIFKLIATSQSGDILEITQSGIYKKRDSTWAKELTENEVEAKFPQIEGVIKNLNIWQSLSSDEQSLGKSNAVSSNFVSEVIEKEETRERSVIVEVRIVDKTLPNMKALKDKLKKIHPELVNSITFHSKLHKTLQEEHAALMEQKKIAPQLHVELLNKIKENEQFLGYLIQTGRTALYGQQQVNSLETPSIRRIAMGKAKEVFVRQEIPQYVYYTPLYCIFRTKESELKHELQIARQIASNLFESDLVDLFKKNGLSQPEKIARNLVSKYKTPEELAHFLAGGEVPSYLEPFSIPQDGARKILDLRKAITKLSARENNLMIDLHEVGERENIQGKYTVRTSKAASDLEKEILKNPSFRNKVNFVSGFFNGMENMHKSGHVHGDLKPENLLVYEDMSKNERGRPAKLVKISDFGKTRSLKENERLMYTGNPRFSSPEKKLSREGEVYSSALIAIRVLEEGLLNPTHMMLIEPAQKDLSIQPRPDRRGIEKYAVLSASMPQTESSTLKGKVRAYGPDVFSSPVDLDEAQIELHAYIDVLTSALEKAEHISPEKIETLNILLKEMTLSNPAKRPTMSEVNSRFNEIGLS